MPNKRICNNAKISEHFAIIPTLQAPKPVSYTHLEVYKRQGYDSTRQAREGELDRITLAHTNHRSRNLAAKCQKIKGHARFDFRHHLYCVQGDLMVLWFCPIHWACLLYTSRCV